MTVQAKTAPKKKRHRLRDLNWFGVVSVISWLVLAGIIVWLLQTRNDVANTAKKEAVHDAQIKAAAQARRNTYRTTYLTVNAQCVMSIPILNTLNGYFAGEKQLARAAVTNARAVRDGTPKSDPSYPTRAANAARLGRAAAAVARVKRFPIPTKPKCKARATDAALTAIGKTPKKKGPAKPAG